MNINDRGTVAAEAAISNATTMLAKQSGPHFMIHVASFKQYSLNSLGNTCRVVHARGYNSSSTAAPEASKAVQD
jgi:hypothetical protein